MDSIMSTIVNRRSIRSYTSEKISKNDITKILTAASWAPSGNNLQPWKFSVVMNNEELIKRLSSLTIYQSWLQTSPCLIAVFLDTKVVDNKVEGIYLKHVQAIGAAIQNMLLAAHELGLGTCWIGEILKNEDLVKEMLGASKELELMAVISVGYPNKNNIRSKRRVISENIISWF
ncbi:nitroreductase [Pelosinus sp. UFO1]|uniref:nitroreductase family protein n=1 Tax=Pelosinus sp. UFO1 TaxID=484770 RepID=UPI0004D1C8F6|nr:nitroreductase [Pelosinus sp. UFO1]AIF53617.1 nitroreductase [Pelosinus sp. UFO1]